MPHPNAVTTEEKERLRLEESAACIRRLRDPDPRVRTKAAQRLGQLRAGAAELLDALGDRNGYVRTAAAEAVGLAGDPADPETADRLLAAIDDNSFVCAMALRALGNLGVAEARVEVEGCLEDQNPHVLREAVVAAARLDSPVLRERLDGFLAHPDARVRAAAATATAVLEHGPAGAALLAAFERELGLASADPRVLTSYLEAIEKLKLAEAVPRLVEIARGFVGLRTRAVRALAVIGAREAIPALLPLLDDPNPDLRGLVFRLVAQSDSPDAAFHVRPYLGSSAPDLRLRALHAVAGLHDTGAVEAVRRICFSDPSPLVRPVAVQTLVALLGADSAPDLRQLLGDVNAEVAREAKAQLERLAEDGPLDPQAPAEADQRMRLPPQVAGRASELAALLRAWRDVPEADAQLGDALATLISRLEAGASDPGGA